MVFMTDNLIILRSYSTFTQKKVSFIFFFFVFFFLFSFVFGVFGFSDVVDLELALDLL